MANSFDIAYNAWMLKFLKIKINIKIRIRTKIGVFPYRL